MAKHKLDQFTDETFAATEANWKAVAGDDEFASEYGHHFDWMKAHRDYTPGASKGDSLAYGLFAPDASHACAVIEVINDRKGTAGLTKLLKVFITPEYWQVEEHQEQIIEIFVSAIVGTIDLSKQVKARTVKLYGRSNQLLSLLHSLHVYLKANADKFPGTAAAVKGRWLEIVTT